MQDKGRRDLADKMTLMAGMKDETAKIFWSETDGQKWRLNTMNRVVIKKYLLALADFKKAS